MTIGLAPLCTTCKHFTPEKGNPKCAAFPNGVPDDIFWGDHDHRKPYPGDGGIVYEPKNK